MPTLLPTSQMQEILETHSKMGPLPIESLTPEFARQIPLLDRAAIALYGQHFTNRAFAPMPPPVGKVENKRIPGPAESILIRIYTPPGDAPQGGWPIIVYYHGGGWVIADLNTYDASCRTLCLASEALVVSVHYRQAPENPWPAAPEDAYTAFEWVASNALSLHGNEKKIAIAGESAGGNLAAVVSLLARDKGTFQPIHQLLIYPVTDLVNGTQSESALQNEFAKPLNTAMLHWFYNHYAPPGIERTDPYISPLHANLESLPPATIILASLDPLRSDGEAYALKLAASHVPVNVKVYEGVAHEFFGLSGLVDEAKEAVAFAAENLKKSFESKNK